MLSPTALLALFSETAQELLTGTHREPKCSCRMSYGNIEEGEWQAVACFFNCKTSNNNKTYNWNFKDLNMLIIAAVWTLEKKCFSLGAAFLLIRWEKKIKTPYRMKMFIFRTLEHLVIYLRVCGSKKCFGNSSVTIAGALQKSE